MNKPKLKASSRVKPTDAKPKYGVPGQNAPIRYETVSWSKVLQKWFKGVLAFIALFVVLVSASYVGLSATVAYLVRGDDGTGYIVARNTFIGGDVPTGAIVYTSTVTPPAQEDLLGKIMQGVNGLFTGDGVEKPAVFKALVGPTNGLQVNGNTVTVAAGTEDEVTFTEPIQNLKTSKTYLQDQYIMECKSGNCEPGTLYAVDSDLIAGELLTIEGKEMK